MQEGDLLVRKQGVEGKKKKKKKKKKSNCPLVGKTKKRLEHPLFRMAVPKIEEHGEKSRKEKPVPRRRRKKGLAFLKKFTGAFAGG